MKQLGKEVKGRLNPDEKERGLGHSDVRQEELKTSLRLLKFTIYSVRLFSGCLEKH